MSSHMEVRISHRLFDCIHPTMPTRCSPRYWDLVQAQLFLEGWHILHSPASIRPGAVRHHHDVPRRSPSLPDEIPLQAPFLIMALEQDFRSGKAESSLPEGAGLIGAGEWRMCQRSKELDGARFPIPRRTPCGHGRIDLGGEQAIGYPDFHVGSSKLIARTKLGPLFTTRGSNERS